MTDLTFGRLKVIEMAGKNKRNEIMWLCECQCENRTKVVVSGALLRNGTTKSCGCLNRELSSKRATLRNTKHNQSHTKLYRTWNDMRQRTANPKREDYKNYGARNIHICNEWLDFIAFKDWALENGYREDLTIERKDVNGDYCPENCCWIPFEKQAQNKRNTVKIEYAGEILTLKEWSIRLGINLNTLKTRYYRGYPVEKILKTNKENE